MSVDYIIVGQGLAGSLLGYFLQRGGAKVFFLDAEQPDSASRLAAGIINPITGRNLVKTWLADEAIPAAIAFYQQLETQLGLPLWRPQALTWILEDAKMWNDFQATSANPQTAQYVARIDGPNDYSSRLYDAQGAAILQHSGRVDLPAIVRAFRQYFAPHYRREIFDYTALQIIDNQKVIYKDLAAKAVIFCQGAADQTNPFFGYLPFAPAKGEILELEISQYPFENQLIKHKGLLLAPLGGGRYWLGASYIRDFQDAAPTAAERDALDQQWQKIWRGDYQIRDHRAALRPTVRDRKPFLGAHPKYNNLFIFNGLGAKGTYLGPHFAQIMSRHLLAGEPIPKEVNILRVKH